MRKYKLWMLAAGLLAAAILPNWAQSASYTVTEASDDGTGAANSLSWAVNQANGTTEADTITLQTDVTLSAALPQITSTMTIEGGGFIIEAAGGNFSVLHVTSDGDLTLNEAMVSGANKLSGYGGGINNDGGTVTLTNSIVSENKAANGSGGGIYNFGMVTMTNSTVTSNTAQYYGGGIDNSGTVRLTNSTVSKNTASNKGGGIFNGNSNVATLTNSTVSENTSNEAGGGIYNSNSGDLTLTNSTVSKNIVTSTWPAGNYSGGGIFNDPSAFATLTNSTVSGNTVVDYGGGVYNMGTLTLQRSIISGNTAPDGGNEFYDLDTIVGNSFNVFGHSGETSAEAFIGFAPGMNDVNAASDATNTLLTDILDTNLTDNGGPTLTHALVSISPAIDLDTSCNGGLITTDQRGYGRPVGLGCDAGAYEYAAVPVLTVTPSAGTGGSVTPDTAQTVNNGDTASFTVTPDAGYTADSTVVGTCPQGTWSGSTYTTGQIDADCTVEFTFIADKKKINMVPIYKLLLLK